MVKTHLSLTHDPNRKGVAEGWILPVRDILVFGGAKFLCPVTGNHQPDAGDGLRSGLQKGRCRCGNRQGEGTILTKGGKEMTAQLISGTEIARQIREELKGETARLKETCAYGSGTGDDPGRPESGLDELCDGQAEGRQGARIPFLTGEPAGDDHGGRTAGLDRPIQPGSQNPRHPRSASASEAYQRDEGPLRHRSEEGCRRFPSGQRGKDDDRRGGLSSLHAGGDPAAPDPFGGQDRRGGGRRRRPVEHRRQADH